MSNPSDTLCAWIMFTNRLVELFSLHENIYQWDRQATHGCISRPLPLSNTTGVRVLSVPNRRKQKREKNVLPETQTAYIRETVSWYRCNYDCYSSWPVNATEWFSVFYSTEIIITSGPMYKHSETLVLNTVIIGKLCVFGDDGWKWFYRFPPLSEIVKIHE